MSTILIAALGSLGDLFPYLALARGLRAADHTVIIATSMPYRDYVEANDCIFSALRPDLPDDISDMYEKMLDPKDGIAFTIRDMLLANVRGTYLDLADAIAKYSCDLFINGFTVFSAPLIAEKMGIPWISTVLAPTLFASAYEPPALVGFPRALVPGPAIVRPWWGKVLQRYGKFITHSWTAPISALRAELSLQPAAAHPLFDGQHSKLGVLALFSRSFAAPQPDWPPNVTQTGFLFHAMSQGRAASNEVAPTNPLQTFMKSGKTPIVFALGSTAVHAGAGFYEASFHAAQRLNERAVFLIGESEENRAALPEKPPENIFLQDYAPYSSVFPYASLIVHQGGVGTTAEALRAGVPQIVVPFTFDQADNALHVEMALAGRTIERKKYNAQRAENIISAVLADRRAATASTLIAAELQAENALQLAVETIESIINARGKEPHSSDTVAMDLR